MIKFTIDLAGPHDDFPGITHDGFYEVVDGKVVVTANGVTRDMHAKLKAGQHPRHLAVKLLRQALTDTVARPFNRTIHYPRTGWR
jgi:hypothetical protein